MVLHSLDIQPYFNPRSLAGATFARFMMLAAVRISIHAPSRERLTLPYTRSVIAISIHAPSRERLRLFSD